MIIPLMGGGASGLSRPPVIIRLQPIHKFPFDLNIIAVVVESLNWKVHSFCGWRNDGSKANICTIMSICIICSLVGGCDGQVPTACSCCRSEQHVSASHFARNQIGSTTASVAELIEVTTLALYVCPSTDTDTNAPLTQQTNKQTYIMAKFSRTRTNGSCSNQGSLCSPETKRLSN